MILGWILTSRLFLKAEKKRDFWARNKAKVLDRATSRPIYPPLQTQYLESL